MHTKKLQSLGLNETEAKAYLALLKLGGATVGELSRETGVARTTLYYSIEELKQKGFVFEKLIDKKRRLVPRSPGFLEKKAQHQVKEAQNIADSISNLIPSLKALSKEDSSFATVTHFEGKESVWEVFEMILRTNKDSYWYGFGRKFLESYDFDNFVNNFSKKRRQYGRTRSYNIIPLFPEAEQVARRGETDFQEFRFLHHDTGFDAGVCIFGHKVAIFSFDKELAATIIEGVAVAKIMHTMFQSIWRSLS